MAESSDYKPKIVGFPGADISPEVLLHRTLGKLECIKAVTVVIQWDDDSFVCEWSSMKMSELCMASKMLSINIDEEIKGTAD
jgi:hypothetical protein